MYNLALALTTQADSPPTVAKFVGSGDALKTREPRVGLLTQALPIRSWLGSGWEGQGRRFVGFSCPGAGCADHFMNFELTSSGGETVALWPLLQCARDMLKQGPGAKSRELGNTQDKG